jgi:hypothetical protein
LGTKAGRKRYETITDGVRRLIDSPAVQETAGVLQAQASGAMATAKSSVTAKLNEKVGDKVGARFGGGHGFRHGTSHAAHGHNGSAGSSSATGPDAESAPPYPAAGHEEFGGDA